VLALACGVAMFTFSPPASGSSSVSMRNSDRSAYFFEYDSAAP
jgi:hypothetical protein